MNRLLIAAALTATIAAAGAQAAPARHAAARHPAPAPAAHLISDNGISAEEVASVLRAEGYRAQIGRDDSGDPTVKSAVDGTNFSIMFYDCNHGPRCKALEFLVGFDLDDGMALDKLNKWNRDARFGLAYLDAENDPYLQLDVRAAPGFTREALASYLDEWARAVPSFKRHINF